MIKLITDYFMNIKIKIEVFFGKNILVFKSFNLKNKN